MLWINLIQDERNILEHLDGINSGLPQFLEIMPNQPVVVNGTARHDLPIPTEHNVTRMASCLRRNVDNFEVFEELSDGLRVKLLPFEERGNAS